MLKTERGGEIVRKTVKCQKSGRKGKEQSVRKRLNGWEIRMPEPSESL